MRSACTGKVFFWIMTSFDMLTYDLASERTYANHAWHHDRYYGQTSDVCGVYYSSDLSDNILRYNAHELCTFSFLPFLFLILDTGLVYVWC